MIREKLGLLLYPAVQMNYLRQANTQQISAINVLNVHCLCTSKKGLCRMMPLYFIGFLRLSTDSTKRGRILK